MSAGLRTPHPRDATPAKQRPAAIALSSVSKTYKVPQHRYSTLKERLLRRRDSNPAQEIKALQGVDLEIGQGEFFGVIGNNGSGKSTLLKVIAKILRPDEGELRVNGTVSPLIELGVGFHPELVARDNVVVNGALLGLGRKEMLRRYPSIMDFAELEDFHDLPIKNYSSGMLIRLGFATAIQVDADVLLLDEVLAVGDVRFQQKCFEVFRRLHREGTTIVLVGHDLASIERFCDRAALIDGGKVTAIGDPEQVINDYRDSAADSIATAIDRAPSGQWGDGSAEVTEVWCEDGEGKRTTRFPNGEQMTIKVRAKFARPMSRPAIGLSVRDQANHVLFNVAQFSEDPPEHHPGDTATFGVTLDNWLSPGVYLIWPSITAEDGIQFADLRAEFASFIVEGDEDSAGPLYPKHEQWVTRP